mmetsp:Transcript_50166/g.151009  ORF Transcript_50166/g.151009 Transcript_50166/m.151009 type:complete len:117 (+) Transcript_50166:291-641(+)
MRQAQEIVRELRRNDLLRLLALAQLKVEELRAEARLLGVNLTDGMGHRDILVKIIIHMRDMVLERLRTKGTSMDDRKEGTPSLHQQGSAHPETDELNVEVARDTHEEAAFTKEKNA